MEVLDRIGIYGTGSVGSALVMELARSDRPANHIDVTSRNNPGATAAILDAASAFSDNVKHFSSPSELVGEYEVVVVCAGEQPTASTSEDEHLKRNLTIVHNSIASLVCSTLIVVGSPVDRLTEKIAGLSELASTQVLGFGGELDRERLLHVLSEHDLDTSNNVYAVGEHGRRVIPVYGGEVDYEAVKKETSTLLNPSST